MTAVRGIAWTLGALVTEQIPDPASLEQAIGELMKLFGASMKGAKVEKLDVRTVTETTTDHATLIPELVILDKTSTIRVIENGKVSEQVNHERREWRFSCRQ